MAAAVLRSSVGLALRRAAPASSSRLSSAAGANTRTVRTYYGYGGYGSRSRYDAHAYSHEFFPAAKTDKADGYFAAIAFVGASLFVGLLRGAHDGFWCRPHPQMTRCGR